MSTDLIVATDKISEDGLAPLLGDPRFEVLKIDDSTSQEFADALGAAAGLIVRSATRVTADMMDSAPHLEVIARAGVGIDNIDLDAASQRGIAVLNAPGGNTNAAAELTVALILALARNVASGDRSIREGRWDRSKLQGVELRGRTLGLIGAGRIGGEVAKRCRAFGMEVIAYDPLLTETRANELGLAMVELDEVIEHADVISLHVPLTDETRGMIDVEVMTRMKPGAFIINASRGGVIDEEALVKALEEGLIGGAALDVYASEPLAADSPLLKAPNLVLTPHLGAATKEAQIAVATEVAVRMRAALGDRDFSAALNSVDLAHAN